MTIRISAAAALFCAGIVLAGCVTPAPPATGCDAANATFVIGMQATPANVEAARIAAGAETARTLSPGQVVTMEYLATRLNLDVDSYNTVVAARCG